MQNTASEINSSNVTTAKKGFINNKRDRSTAKHVCPYEPLGCKYKADFITDIETHIKAYDSINYHNELLLQKITVLKKRIIAQRKRSFNIEKLLTSLPSYFNGTFFKSRASKHCKENKLLGTRITKAQEVIDPKKQLPSIPQNNTEAHNAMEKDESYHPYNPEEDNARIQKCQPFKEAFYCQLYPYTINNKGTWEWEVKIREVSAPFAFGVCIIPVKSHQSLGKLESPFYPYYLMKNDGSLLTYSTIDDVSKQKLKAILTTSKNSINVQYNSKIKTMEIMINEQKALFSNVDCVDYINDKIVPCIIFTNKADDIQLENFHYYNSLDQSQSEIRSNKKNCPMIDLTD